MFGLSRRRKRKYPINRTNRSSQSLQGAPNGKQQQRENNKDKQVKG